MTTLPATLAEWTDAQLPAVIELCRTALDLGEDAAEAGPLVRRLREAAPGRQTVGFLALTAGGGAAPVGVVLGSLSPRDPTRGHIDLVAVHPAARRRGVGRALLGTAEAALAARGAGEVLIAGNAPYYAWPGVDVRYTPAVCAALALGYEHESTAWNMTADLTPPAAPTRLDTSAAESRLAAAGVTVRRAGPADEALLVEFVASQFGGAWAAEVAHSLDRPGAGCHLAVRGGEVLGFAAYGSSRPSWFGPMGTAATARQLGVGGVLLRRCLADQRAAGHARVQIGWVGPAPFYSGAVGARIERVFFLFRKRL